MDPTILVDPPLDASIMKEEIFGPLLPLITVSERLPVLLGNINAVLFGNIVLLHLRS